MNILKSFTLKWWQGVLFKCVHWLPWESSLARYMAGHASTLGGLSFLLLFILPAIYLAWIWWKQCSA